MPSTKRVSSSKGFDFLVSSKIVILWRIMTNTSMAVGLLTVISAFRKKSYFLEGAKWLWQGMWSGLEPFISQQLGGGSQGNQMASSPLAPHAPGSVHTTPAPPLPSQHALWLCPHGLLWLVLLALHQLGLLLGRSLVLGRAGLPCWCQGPAPSLSLSLKVLIFYVIIVRHRL